MIEFAIWSPDEQTFWDSWIAAGICTAPYEFHPDYAQCVQLTDWDGGIIPGKPGWFANARVFGLIEQAMIAGKLQTNEAGELLDVFERTWAEMVFSLTLQEHDPVTNFPPGMRNAAGVTYADIRNISTPHNVWQ